MVRFSGGKPNVRQVFLRNTYRSVACKSPNTTQTERAFPRIIVFFQRRRLGIRFISFWFVLTYGITGNRCSLERASFRACPYLVPWPTFFSRTGRSTGKKEINWPTCASASNQIVNSLIRLKDKLWFVKNRIKTPPGGNFDLHSPALWTSNMTVLLYA